MTLEIILYLMHLGPQCRLSVFILLTTWNSNHKFSKQNRREMTLADLILFGKHISRVTEYQVEWKKEMVQF